VNSILEATAPCRLELLGFPWSGTHPDGVRTLALALDRRVRCRVEARPEGIEIESKDSGERVFAEHARNLPQGPGPWASVARLLAAAGVESGVGIVTQVRVPEDAGLGATAALRVAILAALGRDLAEIRTVLARLDFGSDAAPSDLEAALLGGAHVGRLHGGVAQVERILADPARLEECLLLVDPGGDGPEASPPRGNADDRRAASGVVEAIGAGAYGEVAALLAEVHRGRFEDAPAPARETAAAIVRAGGAAWPSGRLIAVWAAPGARSPGPREAVSALLKAAGLRTFPARVDLRGLELE
jgi:hypothetical protein